MAAEAPQAVTLDLFGTLLDFDVVRDERPLVAELLEEAGEAADAEHVLSTWLTASLEERGRTPFRTVRSSLVHGARIAARRHELSIDPDYWASALETLWATRPLHEEAHRALDLLEEHGIARAIVTNVDEPVLEALVRRTGLDERVDVIVSSHRARCYKPHPRLFRMALARLGVEPGQAVHVGDDPGEDRAGARAAGLRAVLVDPPEITVADALAGLLDA